jgi:uncharacterized membrane protein YbaN (DUF454 family)
VLTKVYARFEKWLDSHPNLKAWLPTHAKTVITSVGALAAAVIGVLTSLGAVHWSGGQTSLVSAETAAAIAFLSAVVAHIWPDTKKEPVAVAAAFTALVTTTLTLGTGFSWWSLDKEQLSSLTAVVASSLGLGSALFARSKVTAGSTTPAAPNPGGAPTVGAAV